MEFSTQWRRLFFLEIRLLILASSKYVRICLLQCWKKHKHHHAGVKIAQVKSIHITLDYWRLDKTSNRNEGHKYSFITCFGCFRMRKQCRAQTLMKASVTAGCRPMCSHERKAASDLTGCDMSPTTLCAQEGACDVRWQQGHVQEPLQASDLKAEQKRKRI